MMMAGQSTPHSLFVFDKKRTGRGRSNRKNRFGGSVRASADPPPPAGEGWLFLAVNLMKRVPLGEPPARGGPGHPGVLHPLALAWAVDGAGSAGGYGHPPLRVSDGGGRRCAVPP